MRAFQAEDLNEINGWLVERGINPVPLSILPETGFLVVNVACGFLYSTDSKLCLLDFYISNPKIPREKRKEALDEITEALLKEAKKKGFEIAQAASSEETIKDRCKRFNFLPLGSQDAFLLRL